MSLRRNLNLALATSLLTVGVTLATAHVSEAKPATIPCRYGHVCGVDGHGQRFDLSKCGEKVPIGLSGPGEFFNNQTPGTWVTWYWADGTVYGRDASGQAGYIDWTPIWWVQAC